MISKGRHDSIIKLLDQYEKVEITELSRIHEVSEMTIRRDLSSLEEQGILERIKGGAIQIKRLTTEASFEKKKLLMKEEKSAIGKALPQFIENNDTVFIAGGTTVLQAAMNLNKLSLRIISNNPALESIYLDNSNLIILGGEFRHETHCIVGEQAINMVSQIFANKAIIGVDGVSIKYGLTNNFSFVEAGLYRKMIEHTHGKVIVVADHTKIGKVAAFSIAPIENIDILITTKGFPEEYVDELAAKGITIVISN